MILTKDKGRSKGDKEGVRIKKSRCVELDGTCCCTWKFNIALSLCGVLGVTLYFFKGFSEVVAKALQSLGVTVVCFLEQKSNLWSSVLQYRHRLFLRYFLCSSLVNLPLLASLKERSIHRELDCFLGAGDKSLDRDSLPCFGRL